MFFYDTLIQKFLLNYYNTEEPFKVYLMLQKSHLLLKQTNYFVF